MSLSFEDQRMTHCTVVFNDIVYINPGSMGNQQIKRPACLTNGNPAFYLRTVAFRPCFTAGLVFTF